eukprot:1417942-Rhodomonas_salina.2
MQQRQINSLQRENVEGVAQIMESNQNCIVCVAVNGQSGESVMQVLFEGADCVAQFFICSLRCFWFYNALKMIAKRVEKCDSITKTKDAWERGAES